MKKMLSLVMLLALVGCSDTNSSNSKTAAEWCYEEITTKTDIQVEHWTAQNLKGKNEPLSQFNYLITTWHSNSGYPVRTEWNCNISFNEKGSSATVYPKSAITYINVERLCVTEGRR